MDLRQFRPTDESYELNGPDSTNQLQVLESQPRNQNPKPGRGQRARNRNKNKASNLVATPLRRSRRLVAKQNGSNATAPIEEALDLTVKKEPRVASGDITIDHSYNKKIQDVCDDEDDDDGSDIFKEGSAALQNLLDYADAESTAPPDYNYPEQDEAVCLRNNATEETLNNVDVTQPTSNNGNKIDIDGVIHETFASTSTETKLIDVYKMEHKITPNENEPNDDLYIEIGPLGTLVPFNAFHKIPWSEALQATHELLSLVFPLNILETHVISQRFAPLEFKDHYKGKPRLDDNKLCDIRYCISERTTMSNNAFIYNIARRLTQLAKRRGALNKGYVVK
uniref:Reticulon-1 n=1 Tax=Zeugodacus cucurbitae TaxID=28588 RepID=A0A0A1WEB6_ZEUCU